MTTSRSPRWVVLTALALVAVNLRTLLTSIPAVTVDIQSATGWSDVSIGLLTTVPVIFMGLVALIVPTIAARFGRTQTVWLALAVLAIAAGIRWWATVPGVLPVSVVLAGTGIALASGLVPSIVREQVPDAIGASTGLWTSVMFTGATLGAALTVPLAQLTGSWQAALALWAVPAVIAFMAWALVEKPWRRALDAGLPRVRLSSLPWRSPIAWALTAYMAINSVVFYGAVAWIAPSLNERGWDAEESGWLFGLFAFSQIIGGLALPWLTQKLPGRRVVWVLTVIVTVACLVIFAIEPTLATPLTLFLFGAANSGGFAMSLGMLSEFAPDAASSARLTAMAFTVTYLVAALGPTLAGAILQVFNSWVAVFLVLAVIALAQLATIVPLRKGSIIR
ncbi:MAG: hypothetical protein B7C55_12355 [Actinomycetales bacterium mxb001]|nr:MAG: hypothetical protein B7C55_12355 [Actinomycetales bacterium mxb001]